MKAGQVPHPHLRNSLEDALALARKHQDPFYLEAALIEAWLALLVLQTICEYASKKDPKDRSLQTGLAWSEFQRICGPLSDEDCYPWLAALLRFSQCEGESLALFLAHA